MTPISPRVLLSAALLAALAAGCASGGRKSDGGDTTSSPRQNSPDASAQSSTLTSKDLDRAPGQPIEQNLNRFPGVVVNRTADGGISVRIRGAASSRGSEPLYIIDGVPIQPSPSGSLSGINPSDIASIQVLKDAASTTMYGSRGANGVVIIKTKKPGQ